MGILNSILSAIQNGVTTPPAALAATHALLADANPTNAAPAPIAPQAAPVAAPGDQSAPAGSIQGVLGGQDPLQGTQFAPAAPNPAYNPATDPSAASPAPAAQAPAPVAPPAQHMGLLGTLGRILSPEPGSFWSSALNNGLVNARAGQQAYVQAQHEALLKDQGEQAKALEESQKAAMENRKNRFVTSPTGAIMDIGTPGSGATPSMVYTPPEKVDPLIAKIKFYDSLPPGPLKDLVARAIPGEQFDPAVMAQKLTDAKALAESKAASTAAHRAPPRGGAGGLGALPPGFHF